MKLTKTERVVMLRLAVGATNRQIADELGVSIKTIHTHRGHVLHKLGVRNNAELARLALRYQWVTFVGVPDAAPDGVPFRDYTRQGVIDQTLAGLDEKDLSW